MTSYFRSVLHLFSMVFALWLISLSNPAFSQEGAPKLSPEEFSKKISKGRKSVVLDIRTPEETAEGHIANAEFINWLSEDFEAELLKLNKKKTYYVYCRSAKRTIPATEKMKDLGFKKVYMLEGGLNNWMEQGKTLVRPKN